VNALAVVSDADARVIVVSDPFTCARQQFDLRAGETLAAALMRLWPRGLTGAWRVYRGEVCEHNKLAAVDLPHVMVLRDETYVIVREPLGQAFAIQLFLALATQVFAPKPPRIRPSDPDLISPNNQIAGQSNTLRPGARVPDIMGRVRAFPDLLCHPVDVYNESNQTIGQMFVLGVGGYQVQDVKLGETPITSIQGADLDVYLPGEEVPPFFVVKSSREVLDVSLISGETGAVPIAGEVDFAAGPKTMTTEEILPIAPGAPITITGTFFNNAVFWVDGVPHASQVTPPFVYLLDGPVVDELGANPFFAQATEALQFQRKIYYGNGGPFAWTTPGGDEKQVQFAYGWPGADLIPKVGQLLELLTNNGQRWRGRISQTAWPLGGRAAFWGITMQDLYGNSQSFPTISGIQSNFHSFDEASPSGGTAPPPPEGLNNSPTNWYAAPMADPEEIWIDIAFPQGLAFYDQGSRRPLDIEVKAEFRRAGVIDAQASILVHFFYATSSPMRFTRRISVATLGLPPGSGIIEVRMTRTTPFFVDTASKNYVQETRWARLAGVRQLVGQTYPTSTVMAFTMSNSRGTSAVGNMALNVIATRILPSWDGSGWTPPAPTTRWADNFVARCKATDGANRTDAELDLDGIYAIQAQLDSLDEGQQGMISFTLDQMQDIDSELAQVADIVRCLVSRSGRRLYVTRDQANTNTIALFNPRTKDPAGETVSIRMTGDADNDCVIVTWVDSSYAWKQRDFKYPELSAAFNPLRISAIQANWAMAYRRALFEWNVLKYRRERLSCNVTEDGRICRPGDVANFTDDTANLAETAGEVVVVADNILTLDRNVLFLPGETYSILLRDVQGIAIDQVPCIDVAGIPDQVQLQRAPSVQIQGRSTVRGTLFAFFRDSASNVRPWLITATTLNGPYVQISAVNYSTKVYAGDSAPLPGPPPVEGITPPPLTPPEPPQTITLSNLSVINFDSGSASAIYRLTNTGNVEGNDGTSAVVDRGDWISPKENFGAYSVRALPTAGTAPAGSPLNVWLPLNVTQQWSITSGGFDYSGIFVEIQYNVTGAVVASANIGFTLHS
jgi:hypothetical protein